MADLWTLERSDGIAVATFRRPPRNLMSMAGMSELEALVGEVASDESVAVLVITGGVDGYFVAHADVADLAALGRGEQVEGDPYSWNRTFAQLAAMDQPVIAAVNGQAWGGGCELSLACTIRYAAASAHFAQPEVTIGIIPGAGGTQRLARLVGLGRAADMVLSGRVVAADEALAIGLVEAVLPDDGFADHVIERAGVIAAMPRQAIVAAKRALVDGITLPLDAALELEGERFIECLLTHEAVDRGQALADRYAAADDDERFELAP